MPLLNFQERFVHFIAGGTKKHTIRSMRKYPVKAGQTLYLYTGLRTRGKMLATGKREKLARKLGEATCVRVEDIKIEPGNLHATDVSAKVIIDGQRLSRDEKEALARRDGFQDFGDMMGFWEGRLPFHGQVIHWDELKTPQPVAVKYTLIPTPISAVLQNRQPDGSYKTVANIVPPKGFRPVKY